MTDKKMWNNRSLQGDIQWDNQSLPGLTDDDLFNTNWNLSWSKSQRVRQKISQAMRGKTLEDLIGAQKAQQGRRRRSEAASHPRPKAVVDKILATKQLKGTYQSANHGMNGKTHKDTTKQSQSVKAQIRQQIKRDLGLGRSDSIPPDVLAAAYALAGLK